MAIQRKKNVAGYTDEFGRFRPIRSPQCVGSPERKATRSDKAKYSRQRAGDNDDVFDRAIRAERNRGKRSAQYEEAIMRDIERAEFGKQAKETRSLLQFVRDAGGIRRTYKFGGKAARGRKVSYDAGELDRLSYKQSGKRGLVTDKGGKTLDGMYQAARESGYAVASMDDLLEKVEAEAKHGDATYATHGYQDYRDNPKSDLYVSQLGSRSFGVFLKTYLLKKFATKAAAENHMRSIRARAKSNPRGKPASRPNFYMVNGRRPDGTKMTSYAFGKTAKEALQYANANLDQIPNKTKWTKAVKVNGNTSRVAKAAISVFDTDFDLDLDTRDVKRLQVAQRRLKTGKRKVVKVTATPNPKRSNKKNPATPVFALAAGMSAILSALQIKKELVSDDMKKTAKHKTRRRSNPVADRAKAKTPSRPAKNPKASASAKTPSRARVNPRRKKNAVPRRRTYEMFQGRNATTAKYFDKSPHAPARMDQLGDLIEIKLHGVPAIKVNPKRYKLCASGGKLWIVGGRIAKPNPASKANGLDAIGAIEHVVYGTRKPHHGDHAYTHYIHKLGEESGKMPILAADREGFPIIRGGNYKIEARGIVD